jgi:hypothetical protein
MENNNNLNSIIKYLKKNKKIMKINKEQLTTIHMKSIIRKMNDTVYIFKNGLNLYNWKKGYITIFYKKNHLFFLPNESIHNIHIDNLLSDVDDLYNCLICSKDVNYLKFCLNCNYRCCIQCIVDFDFKCSQCRKSLIE